MPNRFLYCLVLSICTVLLMSFSHASGAVAPGTLMLAIKGEPEEGYDPILGWGLYGNPLFQSTLLKRDEQLQIVPSLATQYTLSGDGLQWQLVITSYSIHYTKLYETLSPARPWTLASAKCRSACCAGGRAGSASSFSMVTILGSPGSKFTISHSAT